MVESCTQQSSGSQTEPSETLLLPGEHMMEADKSKLGRDVDLFEGWMPESEMAAQRDVTTRTLRSERRRGDGPPWVRIDKKIFYSIDGFREHLKRHERQPPRARKAS